MNSTKKRRVAILSAVAMLAVGGVTVAVLSATSGGSTGSYDAHSGPVTVGVDAGAHDDVTGTCEAGFHVRGEYVDSDAADVHEWSPAITLDEDAMNGELYTYHPQGNDRNGGATEQTATYRGFDVGVYNDSLNNSETTTLNWTCDPN